VITSIPIDGRKKREELLKPYGGNETSFVYAPSAETGHLVININQTKCLSIVDTPEGCEIRVAWLDGEVRTYYSVETSETVRVRLTANATAGHQLF
jgi:hypothetical protein